MIKLSKMPSLCSPGLIWANHNPISTSDVGVHLVLAVAWHVGLCVGSQLCRGCDIVGDLGGLWYVLLFYFYVYIYGIEGLAVRIVSRGSR